MFGYKLFPKTPLVSGEFAIVNFDIVQVLEGEIDKYSAIFKGVMCEIERNEIYTVLAEEVEDPKWGKQYEIKYIGQPAKLDTEKDQKIFLSKILTEAQIQHLYDTFKNPMEVIQSKDIEKLCQVKNIGVATAHRIIDKVYSAMDYSKAYIELDGYGLTNNMIQKLVDTYNSPEVVIQKIKEDPYILANDVEGIGFHRADEIALSNGYTLNHPKRLFNLSKHILHEYANQGHSYINAYDFMYRVEEETGEDLDHEAFGEIIKTNKDFYIFDLDDERFIALKEIYNLEKKIASELIRLKDSPNNFSFKNWEQKIKRIEEEQGWAYTDEQLNAIKELLYNQVLVVTGFGGTGKTSTVGAMTEVLSGYSFAQTALSGRASSRMQEITGEEGFTIHRLLGYNPSQGFLYNKDNQLDVDIVIVDEVSMIGGEIFYKLISAIKSGTKLVLLGDEGQLESIGVMNILNDLLKSDTIKSCQLTKIHRQAAKSGIIETSLKMRNKEQLFDRNFTGQLIIGELQDCEINITQNRSRVPKMIEEHFIHWLGKMDNILELQVIVPMKDRGETSCYPLNLRLQDIYNPIKKGLTTKSITLVKDKKEFTVRVGDKVINRKNNYKTLNRNGVITPIYNGYIGIVKEVDEEMKTLIVDFSGVGEIFINKEALGGIELGYCITTHSSQGSQFDVVIYGLDHSAYKLLNKEQAYTGVTRAKKYCSVVAENKSLRYAISKSEVKTKQTFLKDLLDN
jgi:exodeoxyribonuclease V alpha subunit